MKNRGAKPKTDPINTTDELKKKKKDNSELTVTIDIKKLNRVINEMFNKDELKTLCFQLDLDPDNFPEKKSSTVREIVKYMQRQNRLLELVKEAFSMNKGQSIKFIQDCLK